jgi:hypothetical protein
MKNSSETSMKHKMLRIEPRLAFIIGVLLANRVLIFRFQLLAVYLLLVHNCGECRIDAIRFLIKSDISITTKQQRGEIEPLGLLVCGN